MKNLELNSPLSRRQKILAASQSPPNSGETNWTAGELTIYDINEITPSLTPLEAEGRWGHLEHNQAMEARDLSKETLRRMRLLDRVISDEMSSHLEGDGSGVRVYLLVSQGEGRHKK